MSVETQEEESRLRAAEYLDPYGPLTRSGAAPATGSDLELATELAPEEEPIATGTLFLSILLLMFIFGIWVVVYGLLLNR